MHENVKKNMHFIHQLMIHLTVQPRGALEGTFDSAPKNELTDLHKDEQRVHVRLHYRVYLSCTCGYTCWCNV